MLAPETHSPPGARRLQSADLSGPRVPVLRDDCAAAFSAGSDHAHDPGILPEALQVLAKQQAMLLTLSEEDLLRACLS
jgi:hypothetical protein